MPDPAGPRVLHVVTRYASGGSEQRIRDMVAAVPDAEHWLLAGEISQAAHVALPVEPARASVEAALQRSIDPRKDVATLRRVREHILAGSFDLVATHQSKAGAIGRVAASRAGVPVVHSLSMASFGPGYGRAGSAVFRTVERGLIRYTSAYAVVGRDLARLYEGIGVPAQQLCVVRSGVRLPSPPSDRTAAHAELAALAELPAERAIVTYVGSLEPRKNPLLLLDLLERLRAVQHARDVALVIAGDGPLRSELQQAAATRGLTGDLKLLGHLPDPAVVFRGADVVVLLSDVEGLPQVLVQAAAAGVPFTAFDVSGVRELLDLGAIGSAVAPGDVVAAAVEVGRHLDDPHTGRRVDLSEWEPAAIRGRYAELLGSVLRG